MQFHNIYCRIVVLTKQTEADVRHSFPFSILAIGIGIIEAVSATTLKH